MLIVLVVRQGVGMIVTLAFKRYRVPLFPAAGCTTGTAVRR